MSDLAKRDHEGHPYRAQEVVVVDPRWQAETNRINAAAHLAFAESELLKEIRRGLAIANNLSRCEAETSQSYERRVHALVYLHQKVLQR